MLYSRGFSTIFAEWRTTEEAQRLSRGFQESLRFPLPEAPVRVRVLERDERNEFSVVWSVDIDPASTDVVRKQPRAPVEPIAIRENGPPAKKVDLLILGDGYSPADAAKFAADARRLSDALFQVSPFRERAQDFNVWALDGAERGVGRLASIDGRASRVGARNALRHLRQRALRADARQSRAA